MGGIMKTLTINGKKYDLVSSVPTSSVTLLASAWEGSGDKCCQVVEIPEATSHSKVDLQPTAEQLVEFHHKVLGFVAENDGGVVTVYAIGSKPTNDHTIQITMTEVEATGKIRGNTVGTTMPQSDWTQTDPNKADFIKNKPDVVSQSYVDGVVKTLGDRVAELDTRQTELEELGTTVVQQVSGLTEAQTTLDNRVNGLGQKLDSMSQITPEEKAEFAAALEDLDQRVTDLAQNGGGGVTLEQVDARIDEYLSEALEGDY